MLVCSTYHIWSLLDLFVFSIGATCVGIFHVWFLTFQSSFFFFNLCGGTLGTAATTGLLYQPQMIGDGDCGELGGMKIGRGNRSIRRKPAPAPRSSYILWIIFVISDPSFLLAYVNLYVFGVVLYIHCSPG
jgi:hypothetical protein